jgi:hypothetical protein
MEGEWRAQDGRDDSVLYPSQCRERMFRWGSLSKRVHVQLVELGRQFHLFNYRD